MNSHTIAFFAHIPHLHIDEVLSKITTDDYVEKYLIGLETASSVGDHMHFVITHLFETDRDRWYHNFSKWFKKKFSLSGRAYKNQCKQYGKVKDIRDLERMEAYTVKDKNIRSNYKDEELKNLIQKSYEKEDLQGYYTWFLSKIAKYEEDEETNALQFKKTSVYKNLSHDEKKSVLNYNENFGRRLENIKLYIIKLLKEKKTDSITSGKVNSIFHRYISMYWDEHLIYLALFDNRYRCPR